MSLIFSKSLIINEKLGITVHRSLGGVVTDYAPPDPENIGTRRSCRRD